MHYIDLLIIQKHHLKIMSVIIPNRYFKDKEELLIKLIKASNVSPEVKPIHVKGGRMIKPKVEIVSLRRETTDSYIFPIQLIKRLINSLIQDEKSNIINLAKNKISFRDYQEPMISKCLERLSKYKSLMMILPPGFGKTILSISLWRYIRKRIVILINRTSLINSWKTTVDMCFPSSNLEEEKRNPIVNVVGEEKFNSAADIFICMAQRHDQIPQDIKNDIGIMTVDEAHLFCTSSHVGPLLGFTPDYVIFNTATPIRDNAMDKMIPFFVDNKSHIKVISRRPYTIDKLYTSIDLKHICAENGVDDTFGNKYKYSHLDETRNEIILQVTKQARNQDKKVIIMTSTTDHCDILENNFSLHDEISCQKYYKSKKGVESYNVLIGTLPKISTGFDEQTACHQFDGVKSSVLILCTSIKSVGLFEQTVGRVMRSSCPHIVLLIDDDKTCVNHLRDLMSYIDDTNGRIVEYIYDHKKFRLEGKGEFFEGGSLGFMDEDTRKSCEIDFNKIHKMVGPEYVEVGV